ncbi:MAG: c-type cytochrome [Sediminibacterium sp.]|nr:c-type cytochrome [Sediminibacterium sp.]
MKQIQFILPITANKVCNKLILLLTILISICIVEISCQTQDQPKKQDYEIADFKVDSLLSLNLLTRNKTAQNRSIDYDYVIKSKITFDGYSLTAIFDELIKKQIIDTTNYVINFICSDGYVANTSWSKILSNKGYLITDIKSLKAQAPDSSVSIDNFAPAYITWDINSNFTDYIYPYEIIGFQIFPRAAWFVHAKPSKDASQKILDGFESCKTNCLKCHSINLEGGILGPELNAPFNVTEYWKEPFLFNFIKNPQSIRFHSKMPALDSLSDQKIQSIIDYLSYMKSHKINQK